MDVDPQTLLFTQDSIKNTFKEPREAERIDDAVEAILSGQLQASDFPADLIAGDQALVKKILKPGYWPRVRGYCRSSFNPPAQKFDNNSPAETETQFAVKILKAAVEKSVSFTKWAWSTVSDLFTN
ncbi:hypothetical protein R1sor_005217 [Riccia sorocarpa]|uniref:Uncharacterized protein n=1 Tax=Riccia sorocarpa TaxID=122646 RepID=A0ABD3HL57_9MARC